DSYDAAGNLVSATDAKGQTTGFTYDALNRPVSQSYAGAEGNVLFTYDQGSNAIGHLSRIQDPEGTVSFAYDNKGRIATETRVIGTTSHSIGYSWDATTGDLAGMTYPSGLSLAYARDASGQVSSISLNGTPLVSSVSHLPFGPFKTAALGSVSLTRDYDQRYNATRITAGGFDYAYTRDAGGHVISIANIQTPTATSQTTDYSYNSTNNQLTGTTGATPKTYTYDANGNIVSDGINTFVYDGLNRMIRVENQGGTVAAYGYDSSNRRIRKTIGTTTIHYLYDLNSRLIAETLLDGTVLREYIYLDGEPIALREYQTNPGTYYFINDHLGTPKQLVTATATIAWQAAYLPFGKAQIQLETVKNNLRFPGQYFDEETGLHYNWHRFYDPETGRYISADPIGLDGGMNLYAYVLNNPVNLIDPSGQNALIGSACRIIVQYGPLIVGTIWTAICNNPPKPNSPGVSSRSIPKPEAPRCGCTCICRADADATMPGNIKPGDGLFAFGESTASSCAEASKEAKREAIHALGMKPKHVGCRCNEG
ncbi:MAG: RHS domain-containing protein, partial [Deltaproteobacteria bacterium]|nr:RHS domain-containing protein [Deltaproteobacteria bacterium]